MIGIIGAAVTVLAFLAFIGVVWLAYSPRFKQQHEKDGLIPFLDSTLPQQSYGKDVKPRT